ncbi:hypothetical protein GmHk_20G058215 [Glycine max]|nr:hypothetical protein GmHk_20G058215 [Glycine max]
MMQDVAAPPEAFFRLLAPGTRFLVKLVRVDSTTRFLLANRRSSSYVTFKVYLTEHKVSYSSLTHLHLENVAECRLVFNHWRKTLKIEVGWKHFCETLSLKADMKIVFEFINPTLNRVLYWLCL